MFSLIFNIVAIALIVVGYIGGAIIFKKHAHKRNAEEERYELELKAQEIRKLQEDQELDQYMASEDIYFNN